MCSSEPASSAGSAGCGLRRMACYTIPVSVEAAIEQDARGVVEWVRRARARVAGVRLRAAMREDPTILADPRSSASDALRSHGFVVATRRRPGGISRPWHVRRVIGVAPGGKPVAPVKRAR